MSERAPQKGFTLVEVTIAIGFFVIMSVAVGVSVNKFSSHINLTNLAYDMALSLRQAQVYGVSVRDRYESGSVSASSFQSGYGVEFFSADTKTYAMFADDPGGGLYNRKCGANGVTITTVEVCRTNGSEFLKSFELQRGNYISKFCATRSGGAAKDCSDGSSGTTLTYLALSFMRPDPDAFIRTNVTAHTNDIPNTPASPIYQSACIEMSSADGVRKNSVTVSSTGYISVANACP